MELYDNHHVLNEKFPDYFPRETPIFGERYEHIRQNSNAQSDSESSNDDVSQHHNVLNHQCVLSVDSSTM